MLDLVFGDYTTRGDHGVNMDIWSAGGGGGGIVTPDLHLHHHDGLPKTFHIFLAFGGFCTGCPVATLPSQTCIQ